MKTLMARTQQAVRTYRFDLPLILLKKLLAPLLTTEKILLYSRDVHSFITCGLQQSVVPGQLPLTIHRLDSADSVLFRALCQRFPEKDFAPRWREFGTQSFVAVAGGAIAGFAWVGRYRLRIAEINYQYPLASDELFIYDCFVAPAFRGQGIYPAMIGAILEESRGAGLKRALIAVTSVNRASIRGILKAGFTEFNRIVYLNWHGREQWWGFNSKGR